MTSQGASQMSFIKPSSIDAASIRSTLVLQKFKGFIKNRFWKMELPQDFVMDSGRAKYLKCQTERLQRKIDERMKKRQEKEEKRRRRILEKRKYELNAKNQKFMRDPLIYLQQNFKRNKIIRDYENVKDTIFKLPNLSRTSEKSVETPTTAVTIDGMSEKETKEMINKQVMSFPSITENIKTEGTYKITRTFFLENDPEKKDTSTTYVNSTVTEFREPGAYVSPARIWEETIEQDKNLKILKNQQIQTERSRAFHIPPIKATRVVRNVNPVNQKQQTSPLTINGEPKQESMQKMVLEEVKRVLDVEDKIEKESFDLNEAANDVQSNRGRLFSEESLDVGLKSTTEYTDNFSIDSDFDRRIDGQGLSELNVGSAFDRYGDAVVVLSPVAKKDELEKAMAHSISSSGVGGSCQEEVNIDDDTIRIKTTSRRRRRRNSQKQQYFCKCQLEGVCNCIIKEDDLLVCLKSLDARLQETEDQMRNLQVKTAMKLLNEGIVAKKKIMEMCSLDTLPKVERRKLEVQSCPPSRN